MPSRRKRIRQPDAICPLCGQPVWISGGTVVAHNLVTGRVCTYSGQLLAVRNVT